MKSIKYLSLVLAGIFIIAACQKEYSLETGSVGGLAVGTLKDSLGDCQPITVKGLYFVDSTLTDSSYVTVQVNITTPGSYKIFTDVQNGFSFKDSGYFATTGLINVKLKASGKPILPITSDFTVIFGTSFCLFSVPAIPNMSGPGALYTLSGTSTNCSNAVVQGTYTAGTAVTSTNKVTIEVDVVATGSYSITTTQTNANGLIFTGSGTFTSTGIQTVTLQAAGTPTTAGATSIPITAGSSSCAFTVNVAGSTGGNINLADSAWQFTQGSKVFHGPLDSVAFSLVQGFNVLQFYGTTYNTGDSLFVLGLVMTSSTIQSGTYSSNTFAVFNFSDENDNTIYQANPQTLLPPANVTVTLNYDPVTKIAQGTFTGTAQNGAGSATVPITLGKFKAVVP